MSWKKIGDENKFYVYQYLADDNIPYYIGKGSNDRINESHLPWIQLPSKDRRIIIKDNLFEKEAFDLEYELIKFYGRKINGGILENKKLTRWVSQAGWKHTDETKLKISEKNTGKIRTTEQRQNYKGSKTSIHAEKVKQAVTNMWADPEYKEQRLAKYKEKPFAHRGKPWSPERRAAQMKKQNNKGLDI